MVQRDSANLCMFVLLLNRPDMNRTTHVSLQRGATSSLVQQIRLIQFS